VYTRNAIQHPTTDPAATPNAGPVDRRVRGGYDDCLVAGIDCGKRLPTFAPEESSGKAIAIDPATGAIKWEYRVLSPPWGGLMSTAGNLVFGGHHRGRDLCAECDDRRAAVDVFDERPGLRYGDQLSGRRQANSFRSRPAI
jgi:hypothetical protein